MRTINTLGQLQRLDFGTICWDAERNVLEITRALHQGQPPKFDRVAQYVGLTPSWPLSSVKLPVTIAFEPASPDSNLMAHARRELAMIGEEQWIVDGYLDMIRVFANQGHSGGSASVFIPTLRRLLDFEPLLPLTNDPAEWRAIDAGCSQNTRCGAAFSRDGGDSYYLITDTPKRVWYAPWQKRRHIYKAARGTLAPFTK